MTTSPLLSAKDTLRLLADPVPGALISTMDKKGRDGRPIEYISWYDLQDVLDERAPRWDKTIRVVTGPTVSVVVGISIQTADGPIYREATGTDDATVPGYGSALDRAEASAFQRCCANFGLGRFLRGGKGAPLRLQVTQADRVRRAAEAAAGE